MRFLILVALTLVSGQALAWHTSGGQVKDINVYSGTDAVLVTLVNPTTGEMVNGADVTQCSNKTTFAISNTISPERRSQMLSLLLMAKASGRPVRLSYSTSGGCVAYGAGSSVYRGIVRIIM